MCTVVLYALNLQNSASRAESLSLCVVCKDLVEEVASLLENNKTEVCLFNKPKKPFRATKIAFELNILNTVCCLW